MNVESGEWYSLEQGRFIHKCCACGVEHDVSARLIVGKIALKWMERKANRMKKQGFSGKSCRQPFRMCAKCITSGECRRFQKHQKGAK